MAKKKTRLTQAKRETKTSFLQNLPVLKIALLLFVLLLIFYHQLVFEGKTLLPPDTITSNSYQPFIKGALKEGIYLCGILIFFPACHLLPACPAYR